MHVTTLALAARGPAELPVSVAMAEQPKQSSTRNSRAAALLERYGGESGPTGHASAGDSGAPVSLSAFIGGKAKTARMGHLEGDGRSAPPEAAYSPSVAEYLSLIHI